MPRKQTRGAPGAERIARGSSSGGKLLVSLPADVEVRLRKVAAREGVTLSRWVSEAVAERLLRRATDGR